MAIINELQRIVYLSNEEKIKWMENVKPIVEFNFRHLLNFKLKYKKELKKNSRTFKTFDYHDKII